MAEGKVVCLEQVGLNSGRGLGLIVLLEWLGDEGSESPFSRGWYQTEVGLLRSLQRKNLGGKRMVRR